MPDNDTQMRCPLCPPYSGTFYQLWHHWYAVHWHEPYITSMIEKGYVHTTGEEDTDCFLCGQPLEHMRMRRYAYRWLAHVLTLPHDQMQEHLVWFILTS